MAACLAPGYPSLGGRNQEDMSMDCAQNGINPIHFISQGNGEHGATGICASEGTCPYPCMHDQLGAALQDGITCQTSLPTQSDHERATALAPMVNPLQADEQLRQHRPWQCQSSAWFASRACDVRQLGIGCQQAGPDLKVHQPDPLPHGMQAQMKMRPVEQDWQQPRHPQHEHRFFCQSLHLGQQLPQSQHDEAHDVIKASEQHDRHACLQQYHHRGSNGRTNTMIGFSPGSSCCSSPCASACASGHASCCSILHDHTECRSVDAMTGNCSVRSDHPKDLTMSPKSRAIYKSFAHRLRSKEICGKGLVYAAELAQQAMAELPDAVHWRVQIEMADLAKRDRNFNEARRLYRAATEMQASAAQTWLEYAKMEEERGHFQRCLRILTAGLKHCPYHEALLLKAIKHLERMGELGTVRCTCTQTVLLADPRRAPRDLLRLPSLYRPVAF